MRSLLISLIILVIAANYCAAKQIGSFTTDTGQSPEFDLHLEIKNEGSKVVLKKRIAAYFGEAVAVETNDFGIISLTAQPVPSVHQPVQSSVVIHESTIDNSPKTTVYRLKHMAVSEVKNALSSMLRTSPLKKPSPNIISDTSTNCLVVVETVSDETVSLGVSELINVLDRRPSKSQFEVAISEKGIDNRLVSNTSLLATENEVATMPIEKNGVQFGLELTFRPRPKLTKRP